MNNSVSCPSFSAFLSNFELILFRRCRVDELVPPEYVLVQLDVVPDLPEVVQKAEANGEKVEKPKICDKEGCDDHEH